MLNIALIALCALLLPLPSVAGPDQKKSPAAGKTTPKRATASRKIASQKRGKSPAKKGKPTWRSRQLAPAPQRYKQIQEALAAKGYLNGPATGVWGADWAEALRRFQKDQNLEPTGKLDSLSLIALGLGPKYEASSSSPPPGVPHNAPPGLPRSPPPERPRNPPPEPPHNLPQR